MKIFKKIILIFLLSSFLLLLFSSFCLAQRKLEIIYPTVPGAETPTTTKTALPEYLKYVFTFAVMIAGLFAFGALIYGGFSYLTSAGDPSKMKEGQDQIMAGFLGLIIILSSYLILNTINPQLIILGKLPIEPGTGGIKIHTLANCQEDEQNPSFMVNQSMADLTDPDLNWGLDGKKITSIKFLGAPGSLSITLWSEKEFKGTGSIINYPAGDTQSCKPVTPSTYKSISLDWHMPGVYLYTSDNCTGDKYGIDYVTFQSDSATLPEFDNKTKSIKFIYGDKDPDSAEYKIKYAAILHEKENFMGEAKLYDQDQDDANCQSVSNLSVSSITVYLKPVNPPAGEGIIGQGVRFWEDKNYTGCVLPETGLFYPAETKVANLHQYGKKCGGYDEEKKKCDKDADCGDRISSMDMDGHYVALLFRDPDYKGDCEVFMTSDPDFRNNRIGQCGWLGRSDCLSSFIIKARK